MEVISDLYGLRVVGWYHSHPAFAPLPSVIDISNQLLAQVGGQRARGVGWREGVASGGAAAARAQVTGTWESEGARAGRSAAACGAGLAAPPPSPNPRNPTTTPGTAQCGRPGVGRR
jgi:hypothetical protein